jgi:hypothetical protein
VCCQLHVPVRLAIEQGAECGQLYLNFCPYHYPVSFVVNCRLTYLLTYLLTPCSRVLLEKLTGLKLVKKFPTFLEPESSSPYSQVPATCPYPEPARSSPYPHIPLSTFFVFLMGIFVNCICLACTVVILCVFVYLICICCTICVLLFLL